MCEGCRLGGEGHCLVWGLINNAQVADKVQTLLCSPWSDPCRVCPAPLPCVSLHWPGSSGQGLCCRTGLLWLCWGRQPSSWSTPTFFLQSGFLLLHPVITVLPTRWTLDMVWSLLLQCWLPSSFCVCLPPKNSFRFPSPGDCLQMVPFRTQFRVFLSSAL